MVISPNIFTASPQFRWHAFIPRALRITGATFMFLLATGAAHAKATISVTPVTPPTLRVTVGHAGSVVGNRIVVFKVSRTEKPTGVLGSCHKIENVKLFVDSYLFKTAVGNTVTDKNAGVGYLTMDPPLCTFSRKLTATPISDDGYRAICQDVKGPVTKRISHPYGVDFSDNSGWGIDDVNDDLKDQHRQFTAEVRCLGPVRGEPVNPPPPRGHPVNGNGASNSAQCNFSGSWPVWMAGGSQRQPIPFAPDGKATVSVYRATPNASRVEGHAFVRLIGRQYRLIVTLHDPNQPETFATFTGAFTNNQCDTAEGEYYGHNGGRVTFEGRYTMKRFQGNAAPVRSPVGRPTGSNTAPRPANPIWHSAVLPRIPNWRKHP